MSHWHLRNSVKIFRKFWRNTPTFIANKPISCADSPVGRATRGYVALEELTGKLVFLKDSWRVDLPRMIPESTTYGVLAQGNVPYIAPSLCGRDILLPENPQESASSLKIHDDYDSDGAKSDALPTPEGSDVDELIPRHAKLAELIPLRLARTLK